MRESYDGRLRAVQELRLSNLTSIGPDPTAPLVAVGDSPGQARPKSPCKEATMPDHCPTRRGSQCLCFPRCEVCGAGKHSVVHEAEGCHAFEPMGPEPELVQTLWGEVPVGGEGGE